jgi:hypothetical protein
MYKAEFRGLQLSYKVGFLCTLSIWCDNVSFWCVKRWWPLPTQVPAAGDCLTWEEVRFTGVQEVLFALLGASKFASFLFPGSRGVNIIQILLC